jgi:hypothetical protein
LRLALNCGAADHNQTDAIMVSRRLILALVASAVPLGVLHLVVLRDVSFPSSPQLVEQGQGSARSPVASSITSASRWYSFVPGHGKWKWRGSICATMIPLQTIAAISTGDPTRLSLSFPSLHALRVKLQL